MTEPRFPKGWDEQRVKQLLAELDARTDEEWIAADIRECADHAAKYGVLIGVQNHGDFIKTADNLISLIKRVDSPWC